MVCILVQMIADAEAQKKMKELFLQMAGDDLVVDAYELQKMLNSAFMKGTLVDRLTSPQTSRTLVNRPLKDK